MTEPGIKLERASSYAGGVRQCGLRFAALVAAKEDPVAAADGDSADRALGCVVVDFQVPIVTVTIQRRPILQRVTHGAPRRALRQDFCLDLFQVVTQLT